MESMRRLFGVGLAFLCAALTAGNVAGGNSIEVVSRPYASTPHTFGDSAGIMLSADGHWAVFNSSGNGLVTNDNNGLKLDVFLRDLDGRTTTLVSRSVHGGSANDDSWPSAISGDGRWVLFESSASDLAPGDDNDSADVFLFDRQSGTVSVVSRTAAGFGDGESGFATMTRDGRFILFESNAANLSPLDQNGTPDLYLLDRQSGDLRLVTLNSGNSAAASGQDVSPSLGAFNATLSEDGQYVAFMSAATNLVAASVRTEAGPQLYLRDMIAGTTLWVSQTAGHESGQNVAHPVLSANGEVLAFLSSSLTLGPSSTQWLHLYFVKSNTVAEVPAPPGVTVGLGTIDEFALSADGNTVAYVFLNQLYRYDRKSGVVSTAPLASSANGVVDSPLVSDAGSVIVFAASAADAVSFSQLYSYNAGTGQVALLTPSLTGVGGGNADTFFPSLSADGSRVAFTSYASDLTAEDDKNQNDVFVTSTTGAGPVQLASVPRPDAISATAAGGSDFKVGGLSLDGRFVAFTSFGSDLTPNATGGGNNVFLRDLWAGTNRLVNLSADGIHPLAGSSGFLAMSGDGQTVAFWGPNVTTPGISRSIYVYDARTGSNRVASILADGTVAAAADGNLSADGRYLGFHPTAANSFIYVRDLITGETREVANQPMPAAFAGISPGGRYLGCFLNSRALRLTDWRTGLNVDVFAAPTPSLPMSGDDSAVLIYTNNPAPRAGSSLLLFSTQDKTAKVIATNAGFAAISRDGSIVAYLQGVSDTVSKIFTYEVKTGQASEAALQPLSGRLALRSDLVLSADGRYLALVSTNDLLSGLQATGFANVFVYDRVLRNLVLASHNAVGSYPNQGSGDASLSADGRVIVFQSSGSDLVAGDLNYSSDVFAGRLDRIDSDQDGLEDGWELVNFGDLSARPGDDPDGDGMTNLGEFLAGTNPKDAGSSLRLTGLSLNRAGQAVVSWSAVLGKAYQLQYRSTLGTGGWTDAGAPVSSASNVGTASVPGSAVAGFYRIKVATE